MNDAAVGSDAVDGCLGGVGWCHETVDAGFLVTGGEARIVLSPGISVLRSSEFDHVLDLVLVLHSKDDMSLSKCTHDFKISRFSVNILHCLLSEGIDLAALVSGSRKLATAGLSSHVYALTENL